MSKKLVINGKLVWLSIVIIVACTFLRFYDKVDQTTFVMFIGSIGGYYYGNMRAFYKGLD